MISDIGLILNTPSSHKSKGYQYQGNKEEHLSDKLKNMEYLGTHGLEVVGAGNGAYDWESKVKVLRV